MSSAAARPTPVPYRQVICISIGLFADTINSGSIYPYLNSMVQSFHIAEDERHAGYYVGLLASSYFLAQFIFCYVWGVVSDRIGRKPSLIAGLVGSAITTALFGFSKSFALAFVLRFLAGSLNGTVGVAKSMLGEITDSTNQARAFSIFGLSWGIAGVLAPLIGGLLSTPVEQHPQLFTIGSPMYRFLSEFPYVLPGLIGTMVSLIGVVTGVFILRETRQSLPSHKKNASRSSHLERVGSEVKFLRVSQGDEEDSDMVEISLNDEPLQEPPSSLLSRIMSLFRPKKQDRFFELPGSDTLEELDGADLPAPRHSEQQPSALGSLMIVWRDKPATLTIVMYCFLGFFFIIWDSVFPLWAYISVPGGGLGYTTRDIGIIQASAGGFSFMFQLIFYPFIAKRLGLMRSFQLGAVIALPAFFGFPELVRFINPNIPTDSQGVMWAVVLTLYMFQQMSSELTFISVIIMISNSALPEHMGAVNGLSMSLVSLMRTIGPATGTALLSWSLIHGTSIGFPFDRHFAFYVMAVNVFIVLAFSYFIGDNLNNPKIETMKMKQEGDLKNLGEVELHERGKEPARFSEEEPE